MRSCPLESLCKNWCAWSSFGSTSKLCRFRGGRRASDRLCVSKTEKSFSVVSTNAVVFPLSDIMSATGGLINHVFHPAKVFIEVCFFCSWWIGIWNCARTVDVRASLLSHDWARSLVFHQLQQHLHVCDQCVHLIGLCASPHLLDAVGL